MQPRPGSKLVLDNATQLVDNMSLMSMSSFGDDEEEESTEYSIAPHQTYDCIIIYKTIYCVLKYACTGVIPNVCSCYDLCAMLKLS